ncbi:MAG: hypothetical protein EPO09_04690 [Aquabacterium sp.]|nr:MAG: hypothetical protein EPO09_04690 [Aquabacterium sp.]
MTSPHTHTHIKPHRAQKPSTQRGVTLLIVLIMLVVIGLVSASAMRQAANADLISNNTRLEQLAKQFAETALRFCEEGVKNGTVQIQAANQAAPAWKTFGNWEGASRTALNLGEADFRSAAQTSTGTNRAPQCMAEFSPLNNNTFIVTARGFSPDYQADANGKTQRGAVVWLQSTLARS